ncbi:MAG: hypothetical protein FWD44_02975 [Oscillospiraceae bacterium]|nr:hypothetical protein [Oscillospiraceae bacterium]
MPVSEAQHVKDQIRDNQTNLNALPIVATYSCDNIDTSKYGWKGRLKTELVEYYKKIGTKINRRGFGDVIITKRIINNALEYIHTEGTAIAFYVAHKIIKQGIIIGYHTNHKDRRLDTITFAAPVELNDKRGNMAVVIKIAGRNIYKTHSILTPEGKLFLLN